MSSKHIGLDGIFYVFFRIDECEMCIDGISHGSGESWENIESPGSLQTTDSSPAPVLYDLSNTVCSLTLIYIVFVNNYPWSTRLNHHFSRIFFVSLWKKEYSLPGL